MSTLVRAGEYDKSKKGKSIFKKHNFDCRLLTKCWLVSSGDDSGVYVARRIFWWMSDKLFRSVVRLPSDLWFGMRAPSTSWLMVTRTLVVSGILPCMAGRFRWFGSLGIRQKEVRKSSTQSPVAYLASVSGFGALAGVTFGQVAECLK